MIVKVCGMTDPDNLSQIAALPVDWLGFIFYEKSPRYMGGAQALFQFLNTEKGQQIRQKRVGVFVNATLEAVLNNASDYGLDLIQLHGDESVQYCADLRQALNDQGNTTVELIKVLGVEASTDLAVLADYEPYCSYFLLDTKTPKYGGSGQSFDWNKLNEYQLETPFILSGGIGIDAINAVTALAHPKLAGIDLNSRFETAPGLKSPQKLSWFLNSLPLSISNPFY